MKLLLIGFSVLLLAACGGAAATATTVPPPTATPTPTLAPTATPAPTPAPTNTPVPPPTETPTLTDSVPVEFADLAACLEDRLGSVVAWELVSGSRRETAEEEAVLVDCLAAVTAGIEAEAITAPVVSCLEEGLGAGVVEAVGAGARVLDADEEAILVECLLVSALDSQWEEIVVTTESCLEERLGLDLAAVVASGAVHLNEAEEQALGDCLLVAALDTSDETASDSLIDCLAEGLGADIAALVASGAVPLTEAQQALMGECLLGSALSPSTETGTQSLTACLEERLGADIAAVVASGAIPLTEAEEAVMGECLLGSAFDDDTSSDTVSDGVLACLEKELGTDIAAVVASGAISLTDSEQGVMGDCLLAEALGGSP